MVDFHTHILPQIDDGSGSLEESLHMLSMLRDQQVSTVLATPHFDANKQSIDRFVQRRSEAYTELQGRMDDALPQIRLGAEVLYYSGISRWDNLDALCIEGTRVLLLEMPLARWTTLMVREVQSLSNTRGITVVLAHIERYLKLQSPGVIQELLDSGIYMQVNASFFIERSTRRTALKMLRCNQIHLLGSDCHGVQNRPPALNEARNVIVKKYGEEFFDHMVAFAHEFIS